MHEHNPGKDIILKRGQFKVPDALPFVDDTGASSSVVPFMAGRMLTFAMDTA